MPASLSGLLMPVKRDIAPPWENPPIGYQCWGSGPVKAELVLPNTIREDGMPFSISALISESK